MHQKSSNSRNSNAQQTPRMIYTQKTQVQTAKESRKARKAQHTKQAKEKYSTESVLDRAVEAHRNYSTWLYEAPHHRRSLDNWMHYLGPWPIQAWAEYEAE